MMAVLQPAPHSFGRRPTIDAELVADAAARILAVQSAVASRPVAAVFTVARGRAMAARMKIRPGVVRL